LVCGGKIPTLEPIDLKEEKLKLVASYIVLILYK
jgi:hypothetical protein